MLKGTLLWNYWIVLKAPIIGFVLSVGLLTILYIFYALFFVDRGNSKTQSSLRILRSILSTIALACGLGVALPAFFIAINYKGPGSLVLRRRSSFLRIQGIFCISRY